MRPPTVEVDGGGDMVVGGSRACRSFPAGVRGGGRGIAEGFVAAGASTVVLAAFGASAKAVVVVGDGCFGGRQFGGGMWGDALTILPLRVGPPPPPPPPPPP